MDALQNILHSIETCKSEKKFSQALSLLQSHLVSCPDDYRAYEEIADIYVYMGQVEKAFTAIDFALTLSPDSPTGNYLKGFILLGEDRVEEAVKYLEQSNILYGNNAEVLRNLGWAYTMLGQNEKGISILTRALNLSPEDELITEDLAMALIGTGEIVEGNKLLKKIGKESSIS